MDKSQFLKLNQSVDTLKLHYYPVQQITTSNLNNYNTLIDELKELKLSAQNLISDNKDERFIYRMIDGVKFHLMSSTIRGFAVTIKNGDFSISMKRFSSFNNPCLKVEIRAEYLAREGHINCCKFINSFVQRNLLDFYRIKISELHLCCDIQGADFNPLDMYKFKTRARKKSIENDYDPSNSIHLEGQEFSGLVLGSGNFMLRIYDKTREINKFKDKGFIKPLKWEQIPTYNEYKTVWRIEFQLRREKLKHLVDDKNGLLDGFTNVLNAIPSIWEYCIKSFNYLNIDDYYVFDMIRKYRVLKNGVKKPLTKLAVKKTFQRADINPTWEFIDTWHGYTGASISTYKNITRPEIAYVDNAIKGVFSTMVKYGRGSFSVDELSQRVSQLNRENIDKKGYSLVDEARIKTLDYVNLVNTNLNSNGVPVDGFSDFNKDVFKHIFNTFTIFDNDITTFEAFEQFHKRLQKAKSLKKEKREREKRLNNVA
ncbi:MAG: hypothetical protein PHG81_12895 [Aliarcobacter sp.]|nr:hypothetical protein [Aliarcobacter sp.]